MMRRTETGIEVGIALCEAVLTGLLLAIAIDSDSLVLMLLCAAISIPLAADAMGILCRVSDAWMRSAER